MSEAKLPNFACKAANERLIPEAAVLRVNQMKVKITLGSPSYHVNGALGWVGQSCKKTKQKANTTTAVLCAVLV